MAVRELISSLPSNSISTTLGRVRTKLLGLAFPLIFRSVPRDDLVRLGTDYGGWWVPASEFNNESVCYLAGVGQDISFDQELMQRFGCTVWAIDPTPASATWVAGQDVDAAFSFIPLGLAGATGELRFYAPANPDHISHSIKNLQKTSSFFVADVVTVRDLMRQLGHDRIDLLKLDIEGAEHETIRTMLADHILPRILCVEFDQPEPLSWARQTVRDLKSHGYLLVKVDGFNLTFCLS